jgi:tryptophan halogenase
MDIPDTLREKMELFRTHGRVHRYNNELFTEVAWQQVFVGQNLHPQSYHPLVDVQSEGSIADYMESVADVVAKCVNVMPDHAEYVKQYCPAPGM